MAGRTPDSASMQRRLAGAAAADDRRRTRPGRIDSETSWSRVLPPLTTCVSGRGCASMPDAARLDQLGRRARGRRRSARRRPRSRRRPSGRPSAHLHAVEVRAVMLVEVSQPEPGPSSSESPRGGARPSAREDDLVVRPRGRCGSGRPCSSSSRCCGASTSSATASGRLDARGRPRAWPRRAPAPAPEARRTLLR